MHIFIMSTKSIQGFKRPIENCAKSWLHKLYTVKRDEQTDGQTGANLNPPIPPPPTIVTGHKKSETMVLVNVISKTRSKRAPTTIKHYVVFYDTKNFSQKIHIHAPRRISYVVYLSINIKIMTTPGNADFCICTSHFKSPTLRDWEIRK